MDDYGLVRRCQICNAPLTFRPGRGGGKNRKYCPGACAETAYQQSKQAYQAAQRKPKRERAYAGPAHVISDRDIEDQQLLERYRAGDESAFEAIYAHYVPKLVPYIARKCGSVEWAEDIVQEAMHRASRYLSHGTVHALDGYLFLVARQAWWLRNEQAELRPQTVPLYEPYGPMRVHMNYIENQVLERETIREVVTLLGCLPQMERAVAMLRLLYGHDLADIAEALDWTTSSVKAAWKRCWRKFRAWAGTKSGHDALAQALILAQTPDAIPIESQCKVPGCARPRHAFERCEHHASEMLKARQHRMSAQQQRAAS